MTAKINGKDCKASFMMPPDKTGQIVGFYNGDKYIGLPYHKKYFVVGKKISFSDFEELLSPQMIVPVPKELSDRAFNMTLHQEGFLYESTPVSL